MSCILSIALCSQHTFQAESVPASVPAEDEGVLREKIRLQVEYYLSRQNLLQVTKLWSLAQFLI